MRINLLLRATFRIFDRNRLKLQDYDLVVQEEGGAGLSGRYGRPIVFTFFKHASLAVDFDGRRIYVDPVGEYADYAHLPKADAVLVTHSHYDHLDRAAVEQLMTPATAVVCDKTSAEAFDFDCYTMVPGAVAEPLDGIRVEAVAA